MGVKNMMPTLSHTLIDSDIRKSINVCPGLCEVLINAALILIFVHIFLACSSVGIYLLFIIKSESRVFSGLCNH